MKQVPRDERALAARIVSALLRENYGGLAGNVVRDGNRVTLRLPGHDHPLPLEPDGFGADYRVGAGACLTLDDVRDAVAALAGTRDAAGAAVFDLECRRTLDETRLRVGSRPPASEGPWTGAAGQLRYDALAAALPHPVYPASPCRLGLTDADLLACAPEFSPGFELRWAAVPKHLVTRSDPAPGWWPSPAQVGLDPGRANTDELFPVHPLFTRGDAALALAQAGATLAPGPCLEVRPTLSVRTVAVVGRPDQHVKLPLPASTLGQRNRRCIAPGTLADGALVGRTLDAVIAADTAASAADTAASTADTADAATGDSPLEGLLLADDSRYAHAGHPGLGYLLRQMPRGLDGFRVVPVAALTALTPGGRLVFEELAGPRGVLDLAEEYFRLVFGVAVRLLVKYGIALESHQQNAALVTAPGQPPRLLVKDFDGALLNLARLRAELGRAAPEPGDFTDRRLLTDSDQALADVFITITVHLCAGAVAFGLARAGAAPLEELLARARGALRDALDAEGHTPAAKLLRVRVLAADRLTGKSMITAGTLTSKEHTGAADINKYYATSGPNYLREPR